MNRFEDLSVKHGDVVQIDLNAPVRYLPGATGSVCAILKVETEKHAETVGVSIGDVLIDIEEGDGTFVEVPARYVRADGERGGVKQS